MRYPWVNLALFFILVLLLLTGFLGLTSGASRSGWILWLHGAGGYALLLMFLWKSQIILDVLGRRPRISTQRVAFLVLTCLTVALLATGLFWTTSGPAYISGFSLMTVHAVLALVVFLLFLWHTLARRYIVRVPAARDRRSFLRLGALVLGGAAIAQLARSTKTVLAMPAASRRFTGSYETGSLTGQFPFVSWLFDRPDPIRPEAWQLMIEGLVQKPLRLSYAGLVALPNEKVEATLDCTGGWYSTQVWQGVRLDRLLAMSGVAEGAASFTVTAISGYNRRFAMAEATRLVLATHVNGKVLDHGHGFPVRLVAPDYRGYDWVKWVVRIDVNETSHLLQPPIPLQ